MIDDAVLTRNQLDGMASGSTVATMTNMTMRRARTESAHIRRLLDPGHCVRCRGWATGLQPWWQIPESPEGRDQMSDIREHLGQYDA